MGKSNRFCFAADGAFMQPRRAEGRLLKEQQHLQLQEMP